MHPSLVTVFQGSVHKDRGESGVMELGKQEFEAERSKGCCTETVRKVIRG